MNPGDPSFLGLALELIVKSLVVLVAALIAAWFMRRSSAAVRHLCLSAAAVSLLVLPLASVLMPSWNVVTVANPFVSTFDEAPRVPTDAPAEAGATSEGEPTTLGTSAHRSSWLTWFLIVWGTGGTLLLLRLLGGKIYGHWIASTAPEVEDERILHAVRRVSGQFAITHPVPVVESDHLKVPFVWGLFHPRLVLPPRAKGWSSERIEAVLRHELAHIKRRDILVQFLAQIACCLYWMNPLTWILERWLFIERERACDDMAISPDIKASDYAGYLMEVVEELGDTRNQVWVVSAMAEGTDFKDRILSVLDPVAKRTAPKLGHSAAVLMVSALVVLPLASLHPLSAIPVRPPRSPVALGIMGETRGDKQSDALIALLDNSDADVREHAATALGQSGDKNVVPALIGALDDRDGTVREHVTTALGRLGDERAIPPLILVLQADPDARVREHAASALGMIGKDEDSYRNLVETYESDRDVRVRAHAAHGLGLMREERAFDLLVDGLESRHVEIRMNCAEGLGWLGDPRAVSYLEKALSDRDSRVRESAERALKMLRGR